ncbi:Abortive bacteriophage infection, resistance [Mycobacteriaceae bacterium]
MDFSDELKTVCEQYAEKYNYSKAEIGRGFEAFVVHLSAADGSFLTDPGSVANPMGAELGDYIFRQNEGGIDGYLEDETARVVMLIQAKYIGGNKKIQENDLKAFIDIPTLLASPDGEDYIDKLDSRVKPIVASLNERLKQGWTLILRFATNVAVSDREESIVRAKEAAYIENGSKIRCELVGRKDIKAIWDEAVNGAGGIKEVVELKFKTGKLLSFTSPRDTLVGLISGNELGDLFRQHKNLLFAQNIRLPMLSSTKINPEIAKTAKNTPDNFFYFNNGVSAICTRFERKEGVVQAWDFQIINGAQTVGTLGDLQSLSKEIQVLFRLTTTSADDFKFKEDVTKTNNTQNEVIPWDFRANDPIQKWLEGALVKYSNTGALPAFYYKRKRGSDPNGKGGRALEPEYLGKLRHAIIYGPIESYRQPKQLADNGEDGLYPEAFGIDGEIKGVWHDSAVAEAMFAYALDDYLINTKLKDYKKSGHAYARWLKRLARYIVGAVAQISRQAPNLKLDPKILVKLPRDEFADRLDEVLKRLMSKINDRYDVLKLDRVQPEYDIGRDQDTFNTICKNVIADLTA